MIIKKTAPSAKGTALEETHANVLLLVTPKRYYSTKEYCIIFGQSVQAERTFLAGCYFYTYFHIK